MAAAAAGLPQVPGAQQPASPAWAGLAPALAPGCAQQARTPVPFLGSPWLQGGQGGEQQEPGGSWQGLSWRSTPLCAQQPPASSSDLLLPDLRLSQQSSGQAGQQLSSASAGQGSSLQGGAGR
jgi:hypothetical protein